MESTHSSKHLATAIMNATARNQNSDVCYLFPNVYFETASTIAPYAVNAAFNSLLAVVATLANILVFSAIRKSASLHLPSKLLLCSFVLTDLGVGLVGHPLYVTFLVVKLKHFSTDIQCICIKSFGIAGSMLSCVSLLTMTAISVDRYIALFFHLKYHEIVTTRRVCVVLAVIWLFAGFFASTWLWNKEVWYGPLVLLIVCICFPVTSLSYIKIYRRLRHHHGHQVQDQAEVQAQQQAGNTLDLAKYRRSASSMLWIYGLYILCYLPYICAEVVRQFVQHNVFVQCIIEFTATVIFFNSCLNPFVYCLRILEIRAGVLQTLRNACGH